MSGTKMFFGILLFCGVSVISAQLGAFEEVFAWKQLTYDIEGYQLLHDRFGGLDEKPETNSADKVYFFDEYERPDWNDRPTRPPTTTTPSSPTTDEAEQFFIQYNNLPMGAERVGNRLFVTVPRRRHGIPSTLNYIELDRQTVRSPALKPYPDIWRARSLISVYRTRADQCGRLWTVDTGLLELPVNRTQLQPPAIVVYDVNSDQQILRYPFKDSDIPSASTPTGLASITIDIGGDCSDAYAYIPDLTTFGIIVFSLKENDSWRLSHNFFSFNPLAGNLRVAGQSFQWSDGVFSIALLPEMGGCRSAIFHPLISTQEFSVSTCTLKNKTASSDRYFYRQFTYLGERGERSQSTMHDYHQPTNVVFFAQIGRDAVSCWNSNKALVPENIAILAQDEERMSYPADLHVTGDEVWVVANTLPRFGYARLNTDEYNFYIYRGNVNRLIRDTVCD